MNPGTRKPEKMNWDQEAGKINWDQVTEKMEAEKRNPVKTDPARRLPAEIRRRRGPGGQRRRADRTRRPGPGKTEKKTLPGIRVQGKQAVSRMKGLTGL